MKEINSNELTGVLKQLCIYIEDIAGGLSNAVKQSLKSERLKTELITNVSHDIKTPLTSIINYVDLLKKEDIQSEKAKELEEIMNLPEENIFVEADGRYMYRILENLYSNASKYALENTRIYMDVVPKQTSVVIQMKNISKEKLNISTDELMQRFVRGDSSRNTEGSGLGLSIASSLTELQGGKFHIYLDGDLFKITLGFEKLRE